jgi:hypothetical protein
VAAYTNVTGVGSPVRAGTQGLTFNRRSTMSLMGAGLVEDYREMILGETFKNLPPEMRPKLIAAVPESHKK